MRTGERRHDDSGMSLVEIVIAMLLFGLLAIGVLPLMWGITQSSVHNRELLTATAFAKDKVAAIQAAFPATPGAGSTSCTALRAYETTPPPPATDLENDLEATVTVGACPATYPASVPVKVTVTQGGETAAVIPARSAASCSTCHALCRDSRPPRALRKIAGVPRPRRLLTRNSCLSALLKPSPQC